MIAPALSPRYCGLCGAWLPNGNNTENPQKPVTPWILRRTERIHVDDLLAL